VYKISFTTIDDVDEFVNELIDYAINEAQGFKMSVTTYHQFNEPTVDLYFNQERDAIMFELRYR
jgi:hypothetical protein